MRVKSRAGAFKVGEFEVPSRDSDYAEVPKESEHAVRLISRQGSCSCIDFAREVEPAKPKSKPTAALKEVKKPGDKQGGDIKKSQKKLPPEDTKKA